MYKFFSDIENEWGSRKKSFFIDLIKESIEIKQTDFWKRNSGLVHAITVFVLPADPTHLAVLEGKELIHYDKYMCHFI